MTANLSIALKSMSIIVAPDPSAWSKPLFRQGCKNPPVKKGGGMAR